MGERRDVVDHGSTGVDRGAHHLGVAAVDRDQDAARRERLDDRQDAADLLLRRDRRRARAGGFAADVDDVGAFGVQPLAVSDRRGRLEEAAAVGEAVGRDVDHAHDQRAAIGQARGEGEGLGHCREAAAERGLERLTPPLGPGRELARR